jgi:hypothetical protein
VQTLEVHFCPQCGGDCESLAKPKRVRVQSRKRTPKRFGARLVDAFRYPLRQMGIGIIIGGAILLWGVELLQRIATGVAAGIAMGILAFMLFVFGTGYLCTYLFSVIQSSARGEDHLPDWPDFGDIWNDMFLPLFRLFGTLLICFGPASLIQHLVGEVGRGWVYWSVFSLGLLYAPMALIGVALFETIAAVNPMLVIPSILKTFGHYLAACAVLAIAVVIGAVGPSLADAFIPFVGGLLSWFLSLYFLFVQMRILGVLYHCHEDELNWFPGINRLRPVR